MSGRRPTARTIAMQDQLLVMIREGPGQTAGQLADSFTISRPKWSTCCLIRNGHTCDRHEVPTFQADNSVVLPILKRMERDGLIFHAEDPTIRRFHWFARAEASDA